MSFIIDKKFEEAQAQSRVDAALVISKRMLPRWVYCKYCYKNVYPRIDDSSEDIVNCSACGAGLATLHGVVKYGSYKAWYRHIVEQFNKEHHARVGFNITE